MENLNKLDEIIPYIIGFIAAWGLSFSFINWIYDEIWREVAKDFTDDDHDHELHRYYGGAIGFLETIIYVTACLENASTVIGVWLALKVAGRWERSRIELKRNEEKSRLQLNVIYSNFTIGNALSIIYAYVGYKIIYFLRKDHLIDTILLVVSTIMVSGVFLWYAKKQSKRIEKFNNKLKVENKKPLVPNRSL